ncbi:MAG: endonuclease III [Chitinophagaceae bacterium]|nr:MAG: endonuclease III [Chitinophagaceae bacterium]
MQKKPFELPVMLRRIEKAIAPFPKAAMFELYERGYRSVFEQLLSCLISIRTLDETTIPLSEKLFARARTPGELLRLSHGELADLLYGTQFPGQKAATMLAIAQVAQERYSGTLPADFDALTALKGVGPKCTNLAIGVSTGHAGVSVDVHVHRVVNRWGYVETKSPEKTMTALEARVPQKRWVDVNRLLMPFGKHICKMIPLCSTCPVLEYCRQVGVTKHK